MNTPMPDQSPPHASQADLKSLGDRDTALDTPELMGELSGESAISSISDNNFRKSFGDVRTHEPAEATINRFGDALSEINRKVFAERFDYLAELGVGGMGCVLKAFDRAIRREVAIKRIKGALSGQERLLSRFLREAQLLARLNHPNLVTIHDILIDDDGPYLVLEYVEGESLAQRIARGPIPWRDAIELIVPVCMGAAYFHQRGIVHRDIKPGNILLPRQGSPKLADFGLARDDEASEFTKSHVGLGTLGYMAPEQSLDATSVDARADLYSLAATLYDMVTGERPRVILIENVALELRKPLFQALQHDRERRQESVLQFVEQLQQCLTPQVIAKTNVELLVEGECPECRTKNSASRKFCRKCSYQMHEPCPACGKTTYAWDRRCGQCDVDVVAEWGRINGLLAEKAERFQSLMAEYDFIAAAEVLDGFSG